MVEYQQKDNYKIADLVEIVKLLRGEGGCPWDIEQTHKSIKSDMIEEACEVIEAIDTEDTALLCEELGDVLLQVVFHAGIETDAGNFTFDDVCDGVCKKLIIRHPHVFGDTVANRNHFVQFGHHETFNPFPHFLHLCPIHQFRRFRKILVAVENHFATLQTRNEIVGQNRIQVVGKQKIGAMKQQEKKQADVVFSIKQRPFLCSDIVSKAYN